MSRPIPRDGLLHPLQVEWDADLTGGDPLDWPGYGEQLARLPRGDSVLTGRAAAGGSRNEGRYVVIAGRFDVLGGSMGAVHGERVVRAYRRASLEKLPVVVLASSGGARLQEGMVALAQLARTSAAARAHAWAGLLSVAVFRAPTTGGVLASYGSLTDVRAAQPGATVGFAGPRVVEVTTGVAPPGQSHTAEAAFAVGLVDALTAPAEQAAWVECVLDLNDQRLPGRPLPAPLGAAGDPPAEDDGAWREVLRARARSRPSGIDLAARMCDSWVELRGADPTIRAGLARIGPHRLIIVASDRHARTGRPGAAGFRLARRAIGLADRIGLPLLTLVDTPGAEPGPAAEADGIAGEIAATSAALTEVRVPTVSLCVGEGGSGGAFALSACDISLMLEHSVAAVISPEGAAAILARDASDAPAFAARLRLTAPDLVALGIADATIPEGDPAVVDRAVRDALDRARPGDRLRRLDRITAAWVR